MTQARTTPAYRIVGLQERTVGGQKPRQIRNAKQRHWLREMLGDDVVVEVRTSPWMLKTCIDVLRRLCA